MEKKGTRKWYEPSLGWSHTPITGVSNLGTMSWTTRPPQHQKRQKMEVQYQLVPSGNHRANNVERSIQTLKNHFISRLCSVDPEFHLQLWYRILQQATLSLDLIRKSRFLPKTSSYGHLNGEFDYNKTPLSPPGTTVVVNYRPWDKASWAPHIEPGWYIGSAMEHCQCHKPYIPKTRAEMISDTVDLFPKKFNMPNISSADAAIHAAQDLQYTPSKI